MDVYAALTTQFASTFNERKATANVDELSLDLTFYSGAFLIPYFICLFLLGIPLFFLELGIGQSLRRGSVGVWNAISPYLGGVGIASVIVSFLVGVYYNMIIAWCFYYLFASWQNPLPYSSCPEDTNATHLEYQECKHAGQTQFYWYRKALHTSENISESGGIVWHLPLCLMLAWFVVFLCMMKGVQSAGKVQQQEEQQ